MSFKRYGARGIRDWIDANIRHAQHLHRLVERHPDFEAANQPAMSAICIRRCEENIDEVASKQLHAEVVSRVERSGQFWISTTGMKGTWFRINPVNFRTRPEHTDELSTLLRRECDLAVQAKTADRKMA